jgi:TolB protein
LGISVVASLVLLIAGTAQAAFPGVNGRIAFTDIQDGDEEIYAVDPDGTDLTQLTNNTGADFQPAWSPDGTQIAFVRFASAGCSTEIWMMNADGGDPQVLACGEKPSWSPDGLQIAYTQSEGFPCLHVRNVDGAAASSYCNGSIGDYFTNASWSPDGDRVAFSAVTGAEADVYTVRPDGTDLASLTTSPGTDDDPNWSPDGARIAFLSTRQPNGIWAMNRDGSAATSVKPLGGYPAWSPDGSKIAYVDPGPPSGVWTMDSGGGGATFLVGGTEPDWEPIPVDSYPRPKGATPLYASLTIGYVPCVSPDGEHGPPLASPSCSGPAQTSAHLTVGTGDSNGLPARNEGHLLMRVQPGIPSTPADEADVELDFFLDDVFTTALADYTGELRARVPLQITDKDNTPHPGGPGAATTVEIPLELVVSCTPVADPQEGSACAATTTADALAPGTVKEERRSIWQLGRVEVYDGGPDGDAHTPAGDTLFATQGIFVP